MSDWSLARLAVSDAAAVAAIHRAAFDAALPWLAGLHTPAEDLEYFSGHVLVGCEVWGASALGRLSAFIAFREGWIDQLYVAPVRQGHGAGSALLAVAMGAWPELRLWTFQRNATARRFYEARGFVLIEETDGRGNEEREPDALYAWRRG